MTRLPPADAVDSEEAWNRYQRGDGDEAEHDAQASTGATNGKGHDQEFTDDAREPEPAARAPVEPAKKPRFTFIDDDELEQQPPPAWLVDDVLIGDTVNQLVGAPGALKSFLALDLAAHVVLGWSWHGRAVTRGAVLYVLAEGARRFGLRTRAWKLHHGHPDRIGLHFLTHPVQLADPSEVGQLLAKIDGRTDPLRLIVIDTQARCSLGREENSAMDMGIVLAGAERIERATAASVMLLHHTPRDGERERGSTAQRGGIDATLLVSADGDFVTLKVDRQKDGEEGLVLAFRKRIIDLGPDDTGRMRSSCVLIPISEHEAQRAPVGVGDLPQSVRLLLDALRKAADGAESSATLKKVTRLPDRTFFDALSRAKKWQLVDGTSRAYRITPIGRGLFV